MKVLFLVNWKVKVCSCPPFDLQPPDYNIPGQPYWFFRHFSGDWDIDVVDISSIPSVESFEKNKLRFYLVQTLKVLPSLGKYDLILSHGMQSAVALSLIRRLLKTEAKHIVFDIGSFASASESGFSLKLMQYASKSIDGIIFHTSSQVEYYRAFFPWLSDKTTFIPFGTDLEFFDDGKLSIKTRETPPYILCVGYAKRDWETLVKAFESIETNLELRLVGCVNQRYASIERVRQFPFMSVDKLKRQIRDAEFCVLPLESFNYSFGQMTLMQQMAMGKCVVAARVPSLIDYVVDGENVVFYEPKNVNDCASKLQKVADNSDWRRRLGSNAREYLLKNHSERIMATEIEKYLKLIIS